MNEKNEKNEVTCRAWDMNLLAVRKDYSFSSINSFSFEKHTCKTIIEAI